MNEGFIEIKGARVHNLKNIDVKIPRNKLVVITGLSGSGKSSLAFDTLYAEGQRRYVESLSAYARQFMGRINKPDIDYIKGIPPAIAIEQKINSKNPRSTVGTSTEIYDYLKLLFARIGHTYSPVSGKEVKKHSITHVVDFMASFPENTKLLVLFPWKKLPDHILSDDLKLFLQQGYTRIFINGELQKIEELGNLIDISDQHQVLIVVDRVVVNQQSDNLSRMADSVQSAFFEGHGDCVICNMDETGYPLFHFSNRFEADGMIFEEPVEYLFSFNNPYGACPHCEGFGQTIGIDEDLVIPNKSLSVYQEAIACWKGEKMSEWKDQLVMNAEKFGFPIHKPYFELSDAQRELLWTGNQWFEGLNNFFKMLEENSYKIQYRVMLSRYRGKTTCPVCKGSRLRKEASFVKIGGKTISQLTTEPVSDLCEWFKNLELNGHEAIIAKRLLIEINQRLQFLLQVGLGYLTLNRVSSSLSGGESQRIHLATSLGSSLVGSLYILDEPSIGLHPRDTGLLIKVLKSLRDIGNTVVVVEHDEEIMRAADYLIDIGPKAGQHGGKIVFEGGPEQFHTASESLTLQYMNGKTSIMLPPSRRKWNNYITFHGARENNLKGIDIKIPLFVFTVVTGVSGSGKSSLVGKIISPALKKYFGGYSDRTGEFQKLDGDLHLLKGVEFVDQNPIGKSSRSNPVTYSKTYDEIRKLFSEQPLSRQYGFTPGHFSFNTEGGRCDECQGEGVIHVEMQFMADIELVCESCQGKRFKDDVLEVKYRGKNIFDILELTVDEAMAFFSASQGSQEKRIINRLSPLAEVGLGYVKLGQPSSTLSGGESQRIKLASFLGKEKTDSPTLFIFDEPTTGLHFHDIEKLLHAFSALISNGHTILVIEHNPEIIKSADWIIDLGPEGGKNGGYLVFEGTPEDIVRHQFSHTGKYLAKKISAAPV